MAIIKRGTGITSSRSTVRSGGRGRDRTYDRQDVEATMIRLNTFEERGDSFVV
jgi:hypothetical protein